MDLFVLLVIAAVALFVLARLYAVLGREVGAPPPEAVAQPKNTKQLSQQEPASKQIPSFAGLAALQQVDRQFDPAAFLEGARAAYEMIVVAFSQGDRQTLRPLLEDAVYENYDAAISKREDSQRTVQVDIVRMHSAKIIEAEIDNKTAFITVEFHTDLSRIEKDKAGEVLDNEDAGLSETIEQWTFSRQVNSSDPNWRLFSVAAIA